MVTAKPRLRNRCSGSIGSRARSSQPTNAATSSAPITSGGRTVRLVQPWSLPRTTPSTMPSRPTLARTRPGRSRLVEGPRLSVRRRRAIGSRAMPIGTFSQKIHCHEAPSTTDPPTSGPIAMARPPTAPQAPRARPRRCGDTAADSRVRVSGMTMAAPTPCTARAATRAPMPGAMAAAADPAVNRPRPIVNRRRRPYRSPRVAPVSSRTAKVRV